MTDSPRQCISAVIFDMDGVLVDSEGVWETVMGELFAAHGKSLRDLDPGAFMGGDNSQQWAAYLRDTVGLPLSRDQIVRFVTDGIIGHYSHGVPLISGAAEAVARMAERFPLGLASSSPREVIGYVLERSGLERYFQVWVSSDDVACGKPAPDVYLHCCRLVGVKPAGCIAVEDSRFGIRAAKSAGLKVIAVPTLAFPLDEETTALADAIIDSVDQLDLSTIESLVDDI